MKLCYNTLSVERLRHQTDAPQGRHHETEKTVSEKKVGNLAFAAQRQFATTRHHVAVHANRELADRARPMAELVEEVSRLAISTGHLASQEKLFELDELGPVVGLSLYSGEKWYRTTMDIILVPDLSALAVREDMQYTRALRKGKTFQLVETVELFNTDGTFEYSYPRSSPDIDIETEVMIALSDLSEKAIVGSPTYE